MPSLVQVKVINKVKGQLSQQINQKGPGRLINKVDTAASYRFPSCSSLRRMAENGFAPPNPP